MADDAFWQQYMSTSNDAGHQEKTSNPLLITEEKILAKNYAPIILIRITMLITEYPLKGEEISLVGSVVKSGLPRLRKRSICVILSFSTN